MASMREIAIRRAIDIVVVGCFGGLRRERPRGVLCLPDHRAGGRRKLLIVVEGIGGGQ